MPNAAAVDELLKSLIDDAEDRAFVARCIATEGPAHHRVASIAILKLLSRAFELSRPKGDPISPPTGAESDDDVRVPIRLPPHIRKEMEHEAEYPLSVPRAVIESVASSPREAQAIMDALVDGPPHHALANAAMVRLLEAILHNLSAKGGAP